MEQHVPLHSITIPIMTVLACATWLVGTTFWLTWQWYAVQSSIQSMSGEVKSLSSSLGLRITHLEKESTIKGLTEWTRANQELWCSRTEQRNPSWKCGELPDLPMIPGSKDFWQQGTYQQQQPGE